MSDVKIISGVDESDIWKQVEVDLLQQDMLNYVVALHHGEHIINLTIDIDLGGGFEGGFAMTSLTSIVDTDSDFTFCVHKQGFLDEIGKFFGMQDVVIGDEAFDRDMLVKSNDEQQVKALFADEALRSFLLAIQDDFTFAFTTHHDNKKLELTIDTGITDTGKLQNFYHHFFAVLQQLKELAI